MNHKNPEELLPIIVIIAVHPVFKKYNAKQIEINFEPKHCKFSRIIYCHKILFTTLEGKFIPKHYLDFLGI